MYAYSPHHLPKKVTKKQPVNHIGSSDEPPMNTKPEIPSSRAIKITLKTSFFLLYMLVYYIIKVGESFTVFEDANNRDIAFPSGLLSCRGTTVEGISRIQCAAACYDSTSPLWRTVWFTDVDGDCYCFVFNGTTQEKLGSCTLCYKDSLQSVIFELDTVIATSIYAIPSKLCK